MNIDGAETLILAEFMVLVTFLKSLLPAGMGGMLCGAALLSRPYLFHGHSHFEKAAPFVKLVSCTHICL